MAPLVEPVQYLALKVMKSIRKKDDERPIIATADHILHHIILTLGFKVFTDVKFRELAGFEKLSIEEHDRIFNEIQMAWICLVLFYINAVKSLVPLSDYHFWQDVAQRIPGGFKAILMGYGADEHNAKLMAQLIDLRYKEYELLADSVWEISDDKNPEFKSLTPHMKRVGACMQAIAVGTVGHIRRGELKQGDPLIKFLVEQLLNLEKKIDKFIKKL